MFESIGSIITTVGKATESTDWKEAASHMWKMNGGKAEKVEGHGPIQEMGTQMGFIWNVLQLLDGESILGKFAPSVSKIAEKLKHIGSVDAKTLDGAKSVGTMFENIGALVRGITAAGGGAPIDLGEADKKVTEYGRSLYIAYWALNKLVSGVDKNGNSIDGEGGEGSLKKLSTTINAIQTSLGSFTAETINANAKSITGALGAVANLLGKVNDLNCVTSDQIKTKMDGIIDATKSLKQRMEEAQGAMPTADLALRIQSLTDTGSAANLKALSDVVAHANKVSQQLSKLPTIAVPAQLEAFASGLGFNGSYQYKIQSQGVQINLEIHVTMDADKVEKAIVNRQTSVIRDRINYIMEQSPIKTQAVTDSAYIVEGPVSTANKAKEPHVAPT